MSARVEVQNVLIVPGHDLKMAFRAVCWEHPESHHLIAPWMGEAYVIEPTTPSWFNATLEAKIHDTQLHPQNALEPEFDQLL